MDKLLDLAKQLVVENKEKFIEDGSYDEVKRWLDASYTSYDKLEEILKSEVENKELIKDVVTRLYTLWIADLELQDLNAKHDALKVLSDNKDDYINTFGKEKYMDFIATIDQVADIKSTEYKDKFENFFSAPDIIELKDPSSYETIFYILDIDDTRAQIKKMVVDKLDKIVENNK